MKKYIAEFIGTFALVLCGTGAVIVNLQSGGALGLVGISLAFGLIVTAVIYMFGGISGAHINPAVTISLMCGKLMPKSEGLGYLIAQFSGALLASVILFLLFPNTETMGETLPSGTWLQSFTVEFILTFFLMLTILGVTSKKEHASVVGVVIGLLVTGIILFAGPISGGSFNPARSLAPAILNGNLTSIWIYLLAPTLGAITAVFTWKGLTD